MIYKHTFVLWVFSLQCHCITFDEGLPCGWRFQAMSMFGSSSQSRVAQIIKNRKNPKVDDFRGKCCKIMTYVTKGFIELCRFILSESFYHACFIKKAYSCKSTPRGTLPVQNWYLKSDLWHISEIKCVILFSSPKLNSHFVWDWLSFTDLMLLLHSSQSFQRLYLWCLAGWVRQASGRDWVHLLWVPHAVIRPVGQG